MKIGQGPTPGTYAFRCTFRVDSVSCVSHGAKNVEFVGVLDYSDNTKVTEASVTVSADGTHWISQSDNTGE